MKKPAPDKKLSLSSLLDLQKECEAMQSQKKTAPLDQIPLFAEPKKRGGYRGGHRQKGAGSTVMRIPNDLIGSVTALIEAHKTASQSKPNQETPTPEQPVLSAVTELKTISYYDKYINPKNPAEHWSGRGRLPTWIYAYLPQNSRNIPDALLNPNPQMPINRSK